MMNIFKKVNISIYTYIFVIICFFCGYIKNISIIFFICLIHELGHVFFIKLFGYKIVKIELLPFGGYTTIDEKLNSNINKDLIIAFGGIIFQILLFIFLLFFKNNLNIITYSLFKNYNIILLIFNLLPIIPLDGNKIWHLILEKFFSYHDSYFINFFCSLILLFIFIFVNYYYNLDNYFIITFLIYKIYTYYKDYRYLEKRFLLERYLYQFDYKKIDNHTKDIHDLKKNVFHYFKKNNRYINEKEKIKELLSNY